MSLLVKGVKPALIASGTLTADGTEQTVAELTSVIPAKFYGWVSLANMDAGDKVTLRTYHKPPGGGYHKHATELYEDVLEEPEINIVLKVAEAYKITLEQTAGPFRTYEYRFYKEA